MIEWVDVQSSNIVVKTSGCRVCCMHTGDDSLVDADGDGRLPGWKIESLRIRPGKFRGKISVNIIAREDLPDEGRYFAAIPPGEWTFQVRVNNDLVIGVEGVAFDGRVMLIVLDDGELL